MAAETGEELKIDPSSSSSPSKITLLSITSSSRSEDPWKKDVNELRGRLCLLQTRIQEKEKANAEVFKSNDEELAQHKLARETAVALQSEMEREMLKFRDRIDLLDGRMNLMHRELESLIAWTGFRNDETNSYRNFQEKRNLQSVSMGKPPRSLKIGKAGVQVILVEENDNEDMWEPPNIEYDEDEEPNDSGEEFPALNRSSETSRKSKLTSRYRESDVNSTSFLKEVDDTNGSASAPVSVVTFEKNPDTNKFTCLACPKEFHFKKDVTRHYRIHTGEKPYTCSVCEMKFIRRDQLNNHIARKHDGEGEVIHAVKPNVMKSLQEYVVQDSDTMDNEEDKQADSDPDYDPTPQPLVKRGRGRPRKYPAVESPTKVKAKKPNITRGGKQAKQELQRIDGAQMKTDIHSVERNPVTNKFDCFVCSKAFGNRRDLVRHFRLHTGEQPYKCKECGTSFSRQDKLVGHLRKVHNTNGEGTSKRQFRSQNESVEFPCDKCPEVFTNRRLALRHIAKHAPPTLKKLKCPKCSSCYSKPERLDYHIKITHGVDENEAVEGCVAKVLYDCPDCKKKFAKKKYLDRHLIGCRGLRPFPCPECERTFTQNSTLIQHRAAVHRGIKRFLCAECGKGFYTSGNYKKHMRAHRGERPYKCQLCDRAFVGLSDLRSHEAIHRGIRTHQCPDCDLKFFRRYTLVRHRRVHTGEKPYMCDICGASFTQCGTLKKHKENHSIDVKEWRPPRVKGKKYRVRPQPQFPAQENLQDESHSESSAQDSSYASILSTHQALHTNPPAVYHINHPPEQHHPLPHYETVDFVSIFSQRFEGF